MLNEEKIRLMTEIAMFEKKEGKHIFPYHKYFKSDYISSHLMAAFFGYTFCCCLAAVLWGLYHLEELLSSLQMEMLLDLGKHFALLYFAGLLLYLLLVFFVYRRRYAYARGGMRVYVAKLRRLEKRYMQQNREREITKEGIRHDRSSGI